MQSGIYIIRNQINQKCYIGSTYQFSQRKSKHFKQLRENRHHSKYLQNAFNKYGEENFDFEILFTCPPDDLIRIEQYHINNYKPEYNMASIAGSNRGVKFSDESRARMSKAFTGRKQSREVIELRAKNNSKSVLQICPETFVIIKEYTSLKDAKNEHGLSTGDISSVLNNRSFYGGKFTWEYADKYDKDVIEAKKNKFNTRRAVVVLNRDGSFNSEFKSVKETAEYIQTSHGNICSCCKSDKYTIKNLICIYKEDYTQSNVNNRLASMKLAKDNQFNNIKRKPVLQYSLSGDFINEYSSPVEAIKFTTLANPSGIANCCRGNQSQAGGFIWRYKNEELCQ